MAQSSGIIDSQPQMQKPMLAHLREESSEHVDVNEKQVGDYISRIQASYADADDDRQPQTCAKTDNEAEPTLWMRGGGVIGDCLAKRDIYAFVPGATEAQHAVLTKAFSDAIFMAINALRPPQHIDEGQQLYIFNKYFPPEDRDTVERIYNSIIGYNPRIGSALFGHLVIDATDTENHCPPTGSYNFMVLTGKTIAVCPDFWTYIGNFPPRECSDLPEDIMSWRMTFPGDSIFHMLIAYVGRNAIEGHSLVNFGVARTNPIYTGAANAFFIRGHASDKAKLSVTNYDWYALELYWTGKCSRDFRHPLNEIENVSGQCHGEHCQTDAPRPSSMASA